MSPTITSQRHIPSSPDALLSPSLVTQEGDAQTGESLLQEHTQPAERRGPRAGWLRAVLPHALFIAVVLGIWEYSSGRFIDPLILSQPSEVLATLWDWILTGHLLYHLQFTVTALGIGYPLGAAVAFGLAVVLAELPRFGRFFEIYVIVLHSVPNIALIPLFIVWFGFGLETKILMGFLTVFFIVFIASFQALRNTDSRYLELARILGANSAQRLVKFRLWAAVPFLASAFKLSLPTTALAVVVAEFLGSNRGMGFLLIRSSNLLDMASLFAAVLVVTLLVQTLSLLGGALESRLLAWVPKEKK